MNALQRHGISHLSASALGLWRENPGLWALKYLGGFRDDAGPAAWRGSAVEGGYHAILRGRPVDEAKASSLASFDATCQGELSDEIDAERALIPAMLDVLAAAPKHDAPLIAYQLKVEHWLDDVDVPLIGYIDFIFEDGLVLDLKTTKACPSSPKAAHVRQVAVYMDARQAISGSLLYVTGKKCVPYTISPEDAEHGLAEVRRDALSLQRFLSRFDTPEQVISALPMNQDDFRWSEAATNYLHSMEVA